VIMNPPKMPPHLTLSFITDEEEEVVAAAFGLPSLCDSTLLSVQSPNPVEILSKKSPEKLLLPQPTDLDLETLRSSDDPEPLAWLLGLSSSSSFSSTTMVPFFDTEDPKHLSFCFTIDPVFVARSDDDDDDATMIFFFFLAKRNGILALLVEEEELLPPTPPLLALTTPTPISDLKEGEGEEEEDPRIGKGKEEETSLPSFSWRQKAQIPPGLFL
ncbi:hypothetical protein CFOL_v3_07662, partial [Cephalotus follicularis]